MYLKLHRRLWQAVHTIPPSLRPYFNGKPYFKRSTGEGDKGRARAIAAGFEEEWRGKLEDAKAALKRGDQPGFVVLEDHWLFDEATGIGDEKGAAGKKSHRLSDHVEAWIATLIGDQPKTRHMKQADAKLFSARFSNAEDVRKKDVQIWVNEQIAAGAAVATLRRKLSNLRGFWGYLQSLELVGEDHQPFDRLKLPKASATAIDVLPFETAEVIDLANRARERDDQELVDLIAIAAFTGGRIEELATLEIRHILKADIVLPGTKSDAAPRRLPVHKDLAPVLARLVGNRTEGYLFANLTPNKFGDRSNAIGKRFGRLKTDAGFGREKVFHSIRKCFASQMFSAGAEAEMVSILLGHATGRLAIDVYAQDPGRAAKAKAIEMLNYPGLVA